MKRINGRGPKSKGREFENEIRAIFLAAFPQLDQNDITARAMGDPGCDLLLSPVARKLLPFSFELKRTERLKIAEAMAQAQANAKKDGEMACIISRKNRSEPFVILRLADLIKLLGGLHGL